MNNLIEFVKEQCEIFPENSYMGEYLRKTLKMLQAEPCKDAVSRAELLKIYEDRFTELQKLKHLKDNKGAEDRQMGVNYCINILKELPPVTPKCRCSGNPNMSEIPTGSNDLSSELEKNSKKLEKDFEESDLTPQQKYEDIAKAFQIGLLFGFGEKQDNIDRIIDEIKLVALTHKKGKWVIKATGFPPEPITVCSECGFDRDYYIFPRGCHKMKFCPNCGAEMESEE